jgi:hypothetical protein
MLLNFNNHSRHPLETGRHGSRDRYFGANGEVNGNSKQDQLIQLANLLNDIQSGRVMDMNSVRSDDVMNSAEKKKEAARILTAAFEASERNDSSGWLEIGASLNETLKESLDREGFMRRFLVQHTVQQGNFPRFDQQDKNVNTVIIADDVTSPQVQKVRNKTIFPAEFIVAASLLISVLAIQTSAGDIMAEKLLEAQEAIMVREDKIWKSLADSAFSVYNSSALTLSGGLTVQLLSELLLQLQTQNLNPAYILASSEVLTRDIFTSGAFTASMDDIHKYELFKTGRIGMLLGSEVITDATRNKTLKVLNPGEIYIVSDPNTHGAYSTRGPVQVTELDGTKDGGGFPGKGWHLYETLAMTVSNPRSVYKGLRS